MSWQIIIVFLSIILHCVSIKYQTCGSVGKRAVGFLSDTAIVTKQTMNFSKIKKNVMKFYLFHSSDYKNAPHISLQYNLLTNNKKFKMLCLINVLKNLSTERHS